MQRIVDRSKVGNQNGFQSGPEGRTRMIESKIRAPRLQQRQGGKDARIWLQFRLRLVLTGDTEIAPTSHLVSRRKGDLRIARPK